ncbi:hypothetical protein Tco_1029787 [Tanacetum coccineum]|uniref:Uncharacterized protein n=1 Tax=Tanacetum coccineum TaxID=301880 RepID=A0ABQ5G4E4_9ASTR
MTRVDSLEKDLKQTKLTMGSAIVKLVKKVKKLEGILKRRNVVLSDSKEEEPKAQGKEMSDEILSVSSLVQRDLMEIARAKRNKPITQSQLRAYMMNYLKNQGTWKLSQLKILSFEEVKEEFDKLVKQVESFAPINFEATKDSLKRFGEELQTKTSKRLKSDEAKDGTSLPRRLERGETDS